MEITELKIKFLIAILPILLFLGCGSSGDVVDGDLKGKEVVNQTVSLKVKVGYDDSILSRTTNRVTKRVKYSDINSIKLTIFDSQKSYVVDTEFNHTPSNNWELEVYKLPTNREITFIAEAFDSSGHRILTGKVVKQLTVNTSSIIIPLKLAKNEITITVPSIETISVGDINKSVKRLRFKIIDANSEKVAWHITPDTTLKNYGEFNQTSGELDFRFKNEIELLIDFQGDLKNFSFENRIDLNSSVGDVTTTFFKIYEPKKSLQVSIAPIVDNIYLTFYEKKIRANAIIDSKLLKREVCKNSFKELAKSLPLHNKSVEELLTIYYNALDNGGKSDESEIVDIYQKVLEPLRNDSDINLSKDSNLSKFLNLDINYTYEGLFQKYQNKYGYDEQFKKIYDYLTDDGFQKIMEYYTSDKKNILPALQSFYIKDENFTSILSDFNKTFGEDNFSNLIQYMVSSPESTILEDYNFTDRNFSKNGEYYYSKFRAEDNASRERVNILIEKIANQDFQTFLSDFNQSGLRLYVLMQNYFNDYKIYDSRFAPLLNFRIDENFDTLYQNLKNRYGTNSHFQRLTELIDNRDFREFLDYYKNPTDLLYDSIKIKLDQDVCKTDNFGTIYYDWRLENNSLEIENPYKNPIDITGFNGTLQDTLYLTVKNDYGIEADYAYEINIKDWFDENNNSITIEQENSTSGNPNSSNSNSSEANTTNSNSNSSDSSADPNSGANYGFELYSDKTQLELLYGETSSITFTTSKIFSDFSADILGVVNPSLFEYSQPVYLGNGKYQLDITAKNTTGTGSLNFIVQNQYHSEGEKVDIKISNPIKAIDIKREYTVLEGEEFNISVRFENPRGDTLRFVLNENSAILDAWRDGESLFDNGESKTGVTYNFVVKGLNEGEDNITLRVIDTTMDPDFSLDYNIKIIVKVPDETAIQEELAKYSCEDIQLNSSRYVYVDDAYGGEVAPSPDNAIELESANSLYGEGAYLSRVVVLYPSIYSSGEGYGGSDYRNFYIYNQNNKKYIGLLKYAPSLGGNEFYVKYYDKNSNSIICEKHKFF